MRNINELPECPVATTISLVGSKWKLLIIRNLTKRTWRFNELQKSLNGISQKVLTDSLRQLESDGIIFRKDYHTNVGIFTNQNYNKFKEREKCNVLKIL